RKTKLLRCVSRCNRLQIGEEDPSYRAYRRVANKPRGLSCLASCSRKWSPGSRMGFCQGKHESAPRKDRCAWRQHLCPRSVHFFLGRFTHSRAKDIREKQVAGCERSGSSEGPG